MAGEIRRRRRGDNLRRAITWADTAGRCGGPSDILISTLDRAVHALDGRVRFVAESPGRKPLYLTALADLAAPRRKPARGRPRAMAARRPFVRAKS